jgi:cytochrome c oxidase subunit IV
MFGQMLDSTHGNLATVQALDLRIWEWLLALLAAGLVVFVLPIPKFVAIALVLGAALIKAMLVVRNYMHLKGEHVLLYVIALAPVLLFLAMAITLLPDIAWKR